MIHRKYAALLLVPLIATLIHVPVSAQTATPTATSYEDSELYQYILQLVGNAQSPINSSTGLPQGLSEDLDIVFSPPIPHPNEFFSIDLQSFSIDLASSNITWYENGELIFSDIGATSFQALAPNIGEVTTIELVITKPNGNSISKEITVAPAEVTLLYEAETYVPPFYKGGALFTNQARVQFTAIPDFISAGTRINPNNLVYRWKIDNENVVSASGIGKNTFSYTGALVQRPATISVEVSAINGGLEAMDSETLTPHNPEVVLYENNPLYGTLFENAIEGTFALDRNEVELAAYPFFFNTDSIHDLLTEFFWFTNDEWTRTTEEHSIVFRNSSNDEASAFIEVVADREMYLFQNAKAEVQLEFSAGNDSSFSF